MDENMSDERYKRMYGDDHKTKLQFEDTVSDIFSTKMYSTGNDAVRELVNNEARQCRTAKKEGHKAHINIIIDAGPRRLTITGVGSMGMTSKTLKEVYAVFGKTGNEGAKDTGMYGIGRFSYGYLAENMVVQTRSRRTDELYGFIVRGGSSINPLPASALSIEDYGFSAAMVMKAEINIPEMITYIKDVCRYLGVDIFLKVYGAEGIQSENIQVGPVGIREMMGLKKKDFFVEIKKENFEIFLSTRGKFKKTLLVGMPIDSDIMSLDTSHVFNILNEKKYPPTATRDTFTNESRSNLAVDIRKALEVYYSKFDFENMDTDELQFHVDLGIMGNRIASNKGWHAMTSEWKVLDHETWLKYRNDYIDEPKISDITTHLEKMPLYKAKEKYGSLCYNVTGGWDEISEHFEKNRDNGVIMVEKKAELKSRPAKNIPTLKEYDAEVAASDGTASSKRITYYTHGKGDSWNRQIASISNIKKTLVGLDDDRSIKQWKLDLAERYDTLAFVPRKSIPAGSMIKMLHEHIDDLKDKSFPTSHTDMTVKNIQSEESLVFIRDVEKTASTFGEIKDDGVIVFAEGRTDILIAAALLKSRKVVQYDAAEYEAEKLKYLNGTSAETPSPEADTDSPDTENDEKGVEDETANVVDVAAREMSLDAFAQNLKTVPLRSLYMALRDCDESVKDDVTSFDNNGCELDDVISEMLADKDTGVARISRILHMKEFAEKSIVQKIEIALAKRVKNPEVTKADDGNVKITFARQSFGLLEYDPMLMVGDYTIKSMGSEDGKTVIIVG